MNELEQKVADDVSEDEEEELEINLRQRVRLFNLSDDGTKWCERGIGQVSACYFEKRNETFLLVNAETDGSLLLESKIQQDTAYLKQQGRFIIWTEVKQILGLSFQENAGCDDVWKIICQVQGKDPYVEIVPDLDIVKKEEDAEECSSSAAELFSGTNIKIEKTIKEEVEDDTVIKEEGPVEEPAGDAAKETWFEEMLDIEHAELSRVETDILGQLIELVNRLVSPAAKDKTPPPAESRLLDLFHITEDIHTNEGLEQLQETILYLLALNKKQLQE